MNREATSLKIKEDKLFILDQQKLPNEEDWILVESPDHLVEIIKTLKVRGAPLIGISAVLSLALSSDGKDIESFKNDCEKLRSSRPTAVNLMNAIDRLWHVAFEQGVEKDVLLKEAIALFDEDVRLCEEMSKAAATLINDEDNIITHCNTGGLATVGVGTALGAIIEAHKQGKKIHVFVDETRPLLQGGRLTTWELGKAGVPYTLICDNMAGFLMAKGMVDKVFVGADRITLNGDFANKIGSYSLAVLCKFHGLDYHVVAPHTTLDLECERGNEIPIEQRESKEVCGVEGSFGQIRWAPSNSNTYNPAFDITPVELVTTITINDKVYTQAELEGGALRKFLRLS